MLKVSLQPDPSLWCSTYSITFQLGYSNRDQEFILTENPWLLLVWLELNPSSSEQFYSVEQNFYAFSFNSLNTFSSFLSLTAT